ncbi:DUF3793 family protein [Oribacterium sp. WCC10]|uniref:DUF3793 family protein n=1 Tax=Oribacterium sp. WCC10 TaxID=1855343 RepID=UPI0008EBEA46|nr:DUF3793 family protein [Oribacterium sp. WCC10]SFG42440.1 Protein of unknown function [Oribacterium sp. WCC10]
MANELSEKLLRNCSQTLAGIKTGSIFNISDMEVSLLESQIKEISEKLNPLGVYIERIKSKKNNSLVYVYRKSQLIQDMKQPGAMDILKSFGYPSGRTVMETLAEECVEFLMKRLSDYECFPHEIGLFLGFPVEDVKEFIKQDGRNCIACGFWKVYCNKAEALKTFKRFRICAKIYEDAAEKKRPVEVMTVAA